MACRAKAGVRESEVTVATPKEGDLVQVTGLNVVAGDKSGADTPIVKDVAFSIARGEVLALIGESGSGKTTIALSLMGHARSGCRIDSGTIRIGDVDVLSLPADQLPKIRGSKVAYIAQSAAASFNPSRTIMHQVTESALTHGLMTQAQAERKAVELFRSLALPDPEQIGSRYPHQVSGGQLQRLMAAMALITDPALVILDEPTTALDVTTQIEVLRAFKKIVRERGTTAVYVSHDLAVVAQMADRIVVLSRGQVRETGTTKQILEAPVDAYTRELMAAAHPAPHLMTAAVHERAPPLLEVRNLAAGYGALDKDGVPANLVLNDISLSIRLRQIDIGTCNLGLDEAGAWHDPFQRRTLARRNEAAHPRPVPAHSDRLPERRHGAEPEPHRSSHSRAAAGVLSRYARRSARSADYAAARPSAPARRYRRSAQQ
jgi:peptide/nickel transport system ATP-binding protein